MKCSKSDCGFENPENAKFCGICGSKLPEINSGRIMNSSPILKWGSLILSILLILIYMGTSLLIFGLPVIAYLMYKERTSKIKYGFVWILIPILDFLLIRVEIEAILFLLIPAIIIDFVYVYKIIGNHNENIEKKETNIMGLFNWTNKKKELKGIARAVVYDYQESTNKKGQPVIDDIINFRIEKNDDTGHIINLGTVEIRGGTIEGEITDGDIVDAKGKMIDGVLNLNEIKNVTKNSIIRSKEIKLGHREVIVMGIARMVQMTQQQQKRTFNMDNVLNFRVEQTDKEGNITNTVPVEIRGTNIRGYLADGDRIKVKGKMKDGTIISDEVLNISTNSKIKKI